MKKDAVTFDREKIVQIARDLNVLVVSTDRIGSAYDDCENDEQYNAMFVRFFDELGFHKKLVAARRVLFDAFSYEVGEDGMDELERNFQDLKFWGDKPDEEPDIANKQ